MASDFYNQVYQVVRLIPEGKVTTYGAIAAYLGAKRSSRMVGWAMNNCHGGLPPVPAHRVVNRTGLLTGRMHFAEPHMMEEMLKREGVEVQDNKVSNFRIYFWDPAVELDLF